MLIVRGLTLGVEKVLQALHASTVAKGKRERLSAQVPVRKASSTIWWDNQCAGETPLRAAAYVASHEEKSESTA